jgi:hypothetical protein
MAATADSSEPLVRRTGGGRRLLAVSLGALLVVLVAVGALLVQRPRPLAVGRLPDGAVVELLALTYGTTHRYVDGTWGQRLACEILPQSAAEKLGGKAYTETTSRPALFCWLRRARGRSDPDSWRVTVAGEDGCQLDWHYMGSGLGMLQRGLYVSQVPIFPRRGRMLRVRLYRKLANGEDRTLLAEMPASNPVPGPYPQWTPEPLPRTRQDGAMALALLELQTGLPAPKHLIESHPEPTWTRLRVRLRCPPNEIRGWRPSSVGVTDATGNRTSSDMDPGFGRTVVSRRPDGDWDCWLQGNLCPEEAAWKLKVECEWAEWVDGLAGWPSPPRLPDPGTVWDVSHLTLPAAGSIAAPSLATTRQGVRLQLARLSRLPNDVQTARQVQLFVLDTSPESGHKLRLSLVHATDQAGHDLRLSTWSYGNGRQGNPRENSYWLALEPGSTALNLRFVAHRSRVFDFTVKPQVRSPIP